MSTDRATIKARNDAVLAREKRHARAIALLVYEMEPITAWQVVFFPLLIINQVRQRQVRDDFVANHLFTKQRALEGALDVVRGDRTREQVLDGFVAATGEIRDRMPDDIYSDDIREAQLAEVELLLDHDVLLLSQDGTSYDDLVRGAYPTRPEFDAFLGRLAVLDEQVSAAAVRTVGPKADSALVERMRASSAAVRTQEADRIYDEASRG